MSKYRRSHAAFKLPNELILDASLSFSARRLGVVLYSRRNPFGGCRKSLATLAALAGMSVTTAQKAISELSDAGYIAHINTYRYDERFGRMVYAVGVYQCLLPVSKGFTLIPWSIFDTPMKSSVFVVALYLYIQAWNSTHSHPSLRAICRDIGAGITTVCRAVKALDFVRLFLAMRCQKKNRSFSSNSYHGTWWCGCTGQLVRLSAKAAAYRVSSFPLPKVYRSIPVAESVFRLQGCFKK